MDMMEVLLRTHKNIKMSKQELGKKIETLRKDLGVSTYSLQQKGVHPSVTGYVEKAKANYTIDTLIDYLDKIGLRLYVKIK